MLLVSALMFLPLLSRGAGDAPLDRATLRGVKSVNIVLDPLDPALEQQGIAPGALASRIEARLTAANVAVDPAAAEFLGLRITSVRANKGPFALSLSIGLYQPVVLVRDAKIRTATETWGVETVVMADAKLLQKACNETVDDLVDRFVAAYRSVNPE
jgi:hypothetical protein